MRTSQEPFVSIAIATYNGEAFLKEQLDSLLAQTYRNLEIVVSDDASTDSTQRILEEYASYDPRLRWSVNEGAHGVVPNFARAVSLARGSIVFLSDQDDVWSPVKIEQHVMRYEDPSVRWVYNEVVLTDKDSNPIGKLTDSMPDYYTRRKLAYYAWGSCVLGCATSYRASLLKHIWPAEVLAPGHDSWIQLAIYPAKAAYIQDVLQQYRQHGNNVVGYTDTKPGEDPQRETRAVEENLRYCLSLSQNNRLQLWKRCYFGALYAGKRVRQIATLKGTQP